MSDNLTYRDAGVNIDAGHTLVEHIKPLVKCTFRPGVIGGLGGFGGLFALGNSYRDPVLVSSTDGVGTKLKLAQQQASHASIGIDLVAMCVNDVLVQGAEPLFFLDYFATGKLNVDTAGIVVSGIARGCELAGCALIGGETAEMPDMYGPGEYDLAGFTVAVVERDRMLTGDAIVPGDLIVGISSSGPHANGYALIRHILKRSEVQPEQIQCGDTHLAAALLAPTTIYVKPILELLATQSSPIHGMAHITGGGLKENIIRVIPNGMGLVIDRHALDLPPVFEWLQREGKITDEEMWRTFNCGVGFALLLPADAVDAATNILAKHKLSSRVIGKVIKATERERVYIG